MRGINTLFTFGIYMVFIDPQTNYIWLYNTETNYPIHIFKFYKTIHKLLKGD